jgi:transcriptional regulator with XRE-family HTH domain
MLADLMTENRVSERKLCEVARLNRATLRRFLSGETTLPGAILERALAAFGYELDAHRTGDINPALFPVVKPAKPQKQPAPPPRPKPIKLGRRRRNLIITRKPALVPYAGKSRLE